LLFGRRQASKAQAGTTWRARRRNELPPHQEAGATWPQAQRAVMSV
jgi:hypothetical protein